MTQFSTQLKNAFRYLSDANYTEELSPLNPKIEHRQQTFIKCPLPQIRVLNPLTHNTPESGRYTTYEVVIQTCHKAFSLSNTLVRRRFSEFLWLKKELISQHNVRKPPDLPPKKFSTHRFDDEFIQGRQAGLEKFINSVIREKLFLSDTVLHLFLQTDLTCGEMNDFIEGKISEDFIQNLWTNGGKRTAET